MPAEKTFFGIGCGPIQTGIFVAGAHKKGFGRIVLAEVNPAIVKAVRAAGSITLNTATRDGVRSETFDRVEIYNPDAPADRRKLLDAAAEADVFNTALPGSKFYSFCVPYLTEAFARDPGKRRYFYTSENSTTAAADFARTMNRNFPETYYLDTVIGKMSKIFDVAEGNGLPPLAPGMDKGHLVEEFNTIYSDDAPGLEEFAPEGLFACKDLHPFEEAKLYGHNAAHFVLGLALRHAGAKYMSEGADHPELLNDARRCLINECGVALCRKYAGADPFFETEHFNGWAEELVKRMISPLLADSVDRVIRDLERKLGARDRMIGTIGLCLDQNVTPGTLVRYARIAMLDYAAEKLSAGWDEKVRRALDL